MIALGAERVLTDGRELRGGWVLIDGERIAGVGPAPPPGVERVDLGDADLVPGLVDLHSDCLELKARPRQSMQRRGEMTTMAIRTLTFGLLMAAATPAPAFRDIVT